MQHDKHPLRRVLLMVVCARPVGVSMTDFFSRRVAHIMHIYIKLECDTGKRMIAINRNLLSDDVDNRHQARARLCRCLKLHTHLDPFECVFQSRDRGADAREGKRMRSRLRYYRSPYRHDPSVCNRW